MGKSTSQLDPLTALRDTASLFRRKAEEYRAIIVGFGNDCPPGWQIRFAIYQHEADRLDDLISICDGTAAANASADTLPVAAETIDDIGVVNEQT